jgi:hypothetical protein
MACADVSAAGPITPAADAPLAIDKDTPTAPITGTASFRRFRFEACFGIAEASNAFHGRRRLFVAHHIRTLWNRAWQ